jgi:redox-sensitive bicupin YhaK (pirin superfamily)
MIRIRPAAERGVTRTSWLDSRHTFSFGGYADPQHQHFRALRVINDDRVAAGGGFGAHAHRDMEILTYVIDGALEHQDSLGNGSLIRAGDLQRMTAGTGVTHSERNASREAPVRFLQIWILPRTHDAAPGYEQRAYAGREGLFRAGSGEGRDGAVRIDQDVELWIARLAPGASTEVPIAAGRHAWVQIARGTVSVNGRDLQEGDGAALSEEGVVGLAASNAAEVLVFDLT